MLGRARLALRNVEASMDKTEAGEARASIATCARKVADGLEEAASHVRHAASRTQKGITRFRRLMRARPITGTLLGGFATNRAPNAAPWVPVIVLGAALPRMVWLARSDGD